MTEELEHQDVNEIDWEIRYRHKMDEQQPTFLSDESGRLLS